MSAGRDRFEATLARLRPSDSWLKRLRHHWPLVTYLLLLAAVMLTDSARFWNLDLRPAGAVSVARQLALEVLPPEMHDDLDDWRATGRQLHRDPDLERLLVAQRRVDAGHSEELPQVLRDASPLRYRIDLEQPSGAGRVELDLAGDGRAISIEKLPRGAFEEQPGEQLQAVALDFLQRVTQSEPRWQSTATPEGEDEEPGRLYWSRQLTPELEQRAIVDVRRGRAEALQLELRPTAPETGAQPASTAPEAENIEEGIFAISMLAVFAVFLWQLVRFRVYVFGAVMLSLWTMVALLFTAPWIRGSLGVLHPVEKVLYAFLLLAAGYVALRLYKAPAAESLELLLRGRVNARKVGTAVYAGLRWGGVLGLAAYLPALLGAPLYPVARGALEVADSAFGPLMLLVPRVSIALLFVFAFLLPWLTTWPWMPRRLAQGAAIAFGGVLLALELGAEGPVGVQWLAGMAMAGAALLLFERRDLLAVLAAGYGASVAINAAALLLQPVRMLDAVLMLAALLVLGQLARRIHRHGRPLSLAPRLLTPQRRLNAQRDQLERELSLAREAQMHMLPPAPPALSGYSIAAVCRPAREVGGDLYDFVPVPGGLGLAIGDVSGKGMVASLYMTLTKGLLLAASEHCDDVASAVHEMHRGVHASVDRKTFVTLWYGWLDLEKRRLVYSRAGHNPVLWRRVADGSTSSLGAPGLALGSTKPALFEKILRSATVDLASGDGLFLYTDGLPEAMNDAGEEYGEERLVAAVERTDGLDAEQALSVVLSDVVAFAGEASQHDDMTLVVVRVE